MDVIITPQAAADAGCRAVVTQHEYSDSSTTLSGEKRTFSGSFSSIALNVAKGWKPAQLYVSTTQTINDHETGSETKYLRAGNLYLERYGNAIDLKTAYVDFDGRFPLAELNPLPATPEGIQRWVYNDGTLRRSVRNVITKIEIRFYVDDRVSISTSASPLDAGTTTGGGLYSPGSSVTIKATPNEGYVFQKWTKDEVDVSFSPSYTFSATSDATYVAVFGRVCKVIVQYEGPEGVRLSGHRMKIGDKTGQSDSTGKIEFEEVATGQYQIFFDDRTGPYTYILNEDHYGYSKLIADGNAVQFKNIDRDPGVYPNSYLYRTEYVDISPSSQESDYIIKVVIVRACYFFTTKRVSKFLALFGWEKNQVFIPDAAFAWQDTYYAGGLWETIEGVGYYSPSYRVAPFNGQSVSYFGRLKCTMKPSVTTKFLGGKSIFRFIGSSALLGGNQESHNFSLVDDEIFDVEYGKDVVNDFDYKSVLDEEALAFIEQYDISECMMIVLDFVDDVPGLKIKTVGAKQNPGWGYYTHQVTLKAAANDADGTYFQKEFSPPFTSDIEYVEEAFPLCCDIELMITNHSDIFSRTIKKVTQNGERRDFEDTGMDAVIDLTLGAKGVKMETILLWFILGIIYDPSSGKIMHDANARNILCYS